MSGISTRLLVALFVSISSHSVMAGTADEDLRVAAMSHKGGDSRQAVAIWQDWAAKGNIDAAYNLAVIHQYGDCGSRNGDDDTLILAVFSG